MLINESIVEDAALNWLEELGYAIGHGPYLAPGEQRVRMAAYQCNERKGLWLTSI